MRVFSGDMWTVIQLDLTHPAVRGDMVAMVPVPGRTYNKTCTLTCTLTLHTPVSALQKAQQWKKILKNHLHSFLGGSDTIHEYVAGHIEMLQSQPNTAPISCCLHRKVIIVIITHLVSKGCCILKIKQDFAGFYPAAKKLAKNKY